MLDDLHAFPETYYPSSECASFEFFPDENEGYRRDTFAESLISRKNLNEWVDKSPTIESIEFCFFFFFFYLKRGNDAKEKKKKKKKKRKREKEKIRRKPRLLQVR